MLVEAYEVEHSQDTAGRRVGEAKFAIFPRTDSPHVDVEPQPGQPIYETTGVLTLLRTLSTENIRMHCGRVRYKASLIHVPDTESKSSLKSAHQKVPPKQSKKVDTKEQTAKEPTKEKKKKKKIPTPKTPSPPPPEEPLSEDEAEDVLSSHTPVGEEDAQVRQDVFTVQAANKPPPSSPASATTWQTPTDLDEDEELLPHTWDSTSELTSPDIRMASCVLKVSSFIIAYNHLYSVFRHT